MKRMLALVLILLGIGECTVTRLEMTPVNASPEGSVGPMWLRVEKVFKGDTVAGGLFWCTNAESKARCVKADFVTNDGAKVPWAE